MYSVDADEALRLGAYTLHASAVDAGETDPAPVSAPQPRARIPTAAQPAVVKAAGVLRALLQDGPVLAEQAEETARAHGISTATLRRAKRILPVRVRRERIEGQPSR